jgi:hypothetical protein
MGRILVLFGTDPAELTIRQMLGLWNNLMSGLASRDRKAAKVTLGRHLEVGGVLFK